MFTCNYVMFVNIMDLMDGVARHRLYTHTMGKANLLQWVARLMDKQGPVYVFLLAQGSP